MKLTVGEGLQPLYDLVFRVKRNFPEHLGNIRRLVENIDRYIDLYNDCIWHYSRKPSQKYLDQAQRHLDDLSQLATVLERAEVTNYLSGHVNPKIDLRQS